jgi:nucleoside-diphosphate kinase
VNEIAFFFPSSVPGSQAGAVATTASSSFNPALAETAQFNNCSLCIIKPHAVRSGVTGEIVDAILAEGYEVVGSECLT